MHFKNENDNKSNTHHAATTSTSSSTSSTDSGVIIIDNRTTFGKKINSDNQNNITKKNNNNKSTPQGNGNLKNTNLNWSGESDIATNKIENTTRIDNSISNEKLNNPSDFSSIKCNGSDEHGYNNNKKNCDERNDDCNVAVRNINIENVINISKGHEGVDVPANAENHLKHQNCFMQSNNPISSSPTVSIRSTSISIVSIDENAIDSSVIDSDSDREADAEGVHTNYVVKKLGQQTTFAAGSPDVPNINKGLTVISQKITPNGVIAKDVLNGGFLPPSIPSELNSEPITPATSQIGSIALTNSTDVTFGDKHFYEGPVTIQQILIDRRDKAKSGEADGHDNPTFQNEHGCDTSGSKNYTAASPARSPWSFIRRRKSLVITAIIVVLTIIIGVIFLALKSPKSKLQLGDGDDSRMNIPINSTIGSNDSDDDSYRELLLMSREDWGGRSPKTEDLVKLNLPVHRVIISHTAAASCMEKEICSERVRVIQDFHMDSQKWDDIGFNFLVGGDGRVYTGRGWDNQGAHTKGYNVDSIGISFIGTFTTIEPTKRQITAAKLLIEEGVKLMKLAPNFCLYGARQFQATESPGLALYNVIKTWPHWSENISCPPSLG